MTDITPSDSSGYDDTDWEREFGALRLHQIPKTRYVDHEAFVIPDDPTREQIDIAAAWVIVRGGSVPYIEDRGMLVISFYRNAGELTGDRYYEWVSSGVIVYQPEIGEFSGCSAYMLSDYVVERLS